MQPVRFQSHQIKICCVPFHFGNGLDVRAICNSSEVTVTQALSRSRHHVYTRRCSLCALAMQPSSLLWKSDLPAVVSAYRFETIVNRDLELFSDSQLCNCGGMIAALAALFFLWSLPVTPGTFCTLGPISLESVFL